MKRMLPVLLLGVVMVSGCAEHVIVSAAAKAFSATSSWELRILIVIGALILLAVVACLYERYERSPWEEIDEARNDEDLDREK